MNTKKIKKIIWVINRPHYWEHALSRRFMKLKPRHDINSDMEAATAWAEANSVPYHQALRKVGLLGYPEEIDPELLREAVILSQDVPVKMGGGGDINLLYAAARLLGARCVVETGVALGWSSLAILAALDSTGVGQLISVDMPYPKRGHDRWVGAAVPSRLRHRWTLLRRPDRGGVRAALKLCKSGVDLAHYDSDKTWHGRAYAIPKLWRALVPGGLLIVDDIQDNLYFKAFVEEMKAPFAICRCKQKYVGIARKREVKSN